MENTRRIETGTLRLVLSLLAATLLVATVLVGCGASDPLLKLEAQRAQYKAEAQGFYVDERAVEAEAVVDAEGNEVVIAPLIEKDVFLEILVQNESDEALSGLTVDLEHVNSVGDLKGERKFFLDTSRIGRGNVGQFSETLTNIDYVDGDAFSVNVRSPIPESERSEYREFDGVGGTSQ